MLIKVCSTRGRGNNKRKVTHITYYAWIDQFSIWFFLRTSSWPNLHFFNFRPFWLFHSPDLDFRDTFSWHTHFRDTKYFSFDIKKSFFLNIYFSSRSDFFSKSEKSQHFQKSENSQNSQNSQESENSQKFQKSEKYQNFQKSGKISNFSKIWKNSKFSKIW